MTPQPFFRHPGDIQTAGDQLIHDVPQGPVPVDGGLHSGFRPPQGQRNGPLEVVVDFSVQTSPFLIPDPPSYRGHEAGMIGDVQIGSAIKGSSRSLRFGIPLAIGSMSLFCIAVPDTRALILI